ncbi:zinc finger and BTB domain-containing protein 43 isoform X3 [Myotis lucifugus]|uniref:zinc finger and BTB domain-containing protein 43 isoform X3 n=1 Tax=Myotis lucifugus TaxID=59463 RepID=UPI0003C4BC14|nr:zinc finger and BTB domain-containing protein 43 isoform X3 [Myotis lucifugus]
MEPGTNSFRVEFPDFSSTILQKLNQQRQQGQLCDVSIVVQGHIFRAHKAVLAASSPYFCDQVLLKNSRRIVLPDVMNPRVFENILLSSYTGRLVMPAPEIVSYLTAASFLQMWHVVDKCTEVLEGNPTVLCQKLNHSSDHQSPSSSSYNGLVESFELGSGSHTDFPKSQELRDGENEEESTKDELSSQLTEHEYLPSNSSTEHDRLSTEMASQDGEEAASDSAEFHYTRPLYSKPSIMAHKRWIHVKPERFEQACEGMDVHAPYDEHQVTESINNMQAEHSVQPSGVEEDFHIVEKKVEAEFDEQADESNYDEQVDFYGSSMEEFSGERSEGNLIGHRQEAALPAGYSENIEMVTGIKEEASHLGFSATDKLYPCQCGKSFTHKSQRDRHMSMHLGLRPYGCGVCDVHITVIHLVSRRHCLRKDCGSLSSWAQPVDSDADLTFLRSPLLATAFRESSQRVSSFLVGFSELNWPCADFQLFGKAAEPQRLLPTEEAQLPAPSEVRAQGQNCTSLGRGICCSPWSPRGRGLRHSQPRCLL